MAKSTGTKTNAFGVPQKIDLRKIIGYGVERIRAIRESDTSTSAKTLNEKRLGEKIKRDLLKEDGRSKDTSKITLHTLNGYLTKVRKAFTGCGYKHHTYEIKMNKLAAQHGAYKDRIEAILKVSLDATGDAINDLVIDIEKEQRLCTKQADKNKLATIITKLKKIEYVPVFISSLALTQLERGERAEKVALVLKAKKANQIKLNAPKVRALMIKLLRSDKSADLALGISLATGRRAIETIIQGVFKKTGEFEFEFSGQAKDRTSGKCYKIPSLVSADMILEALARLRATTKVRVLVGAMEESEKTNDFYTPNETFNNRSRLYTNHATKVLGESLGDIGRDWTFKDSRAIYARIQYDLYKSECIEKGLKLMEEGDYFTNTLGHSDETAKENYKVFYTTGKIERVKHEDVEKVVGSELDKAAVRLKKLDKMTRLVEIKDDLKLAGKIEKLIQALSDNDPTVTINNAYLRTHVKGKNTILALLYSKLVEANLTSI